MQSSVDAKLRMSRVASVAEAPPLCLGRRPTNGAGLRAGGFAHPLGKRVRACEVSRGRVLSGPAR